jgi:hypothetical protein
MKDRKLTKEKRYITLDEGFNDLSQRWNLNTVLESRSTQLSGRNWGWIHPTGKVLDDGDNTNRLLVFDFSGLLLMLFYGLSLLFVGLGFYNILGKRREGGVG